MVDRFKKKQPKRFKEVNLTDDERALTKKQIILIEQDQQRQLRRDRTVEDELEEQHDSAKLLKRRKQFQDAVSKTEKKETEAEKALRLDRRLRRQHRSGKDATDSHNDMNEEHVEEESDNEEVIEDEEIEVPNWY